MNKPLYVRIAQAVHAMQTANEEWSETFSEVAKNLVDNHMPSGSGIDSGVVLSESKSKPDHLVFNFGFRNMNETGMYDDWTNHVVHVTPSLTNGFNLRITGKDKNGLKEYLYELFNDALLKKVEG